MKDLTPSPPSLRPCMQFLEEKEEEEEEQPTFHFVNG